MSPVHRAGGSERRRRAGSPRMPTREPVVQFPNLWQLRVAFAEFQT
jgi:hypothetical protein